ncbi:MAG: tetratricopeptide (TPR) repeat protein, partial [Planctomycetota bacterium]
MNPSFVFVIAFSLLVNFLPQVSGQETQESLDATIVAQVKSLLGEHDDPRPFHNDLWLATRSTHGHVDVLVDHLETLIDETKMEALKVPATRLLAQIQRRDGYLLEALSTLDSIGDDKKSVADLVFRAEVLDAQGRTEKALKQYSEILTLELDGDLRKTLLLRSALMQKESAAALAEFVKQDGRTREQKNQASVVLALLDDQETAISAFSVEGVKTVRFRQEVRLAEWAIECKNFDKAQEWAWAAWQSAKMRRDQRYALTLIASAYRRDKAIPELLERFAKLEDMSADARQLWIRLLREEGRVDDALKLFREGGDTKFTAAMRRQLLEICRETGREEILVAAFENLIRTDPGNLEWRSGLSRYRLENGDKEKAVAIWDDFATETKPSKLIDASFTLVDVGLDDVAEKLARLAAQQEGYEQSGLLFVFKMHLNKGDTENALACLKELSALAAPDSGLRADIADGYERVGRPDLAVSTLSTLRENRQGFLGTDLEMKLAILLSKTGREEEALKIWRSLWVRLRTSPRARFVEDRMMTVASRLGVLAKIAIELEDRLQGGDAQDQDVDLLVRLYIKVGDPASATEILEEYLTNSGSADLEVMKRKAKIFLACHDYYNYETLMEVLVEKDEEGRLDHLRELAMSQLERGRRDLAIGLLPKIRAASGENVEIADEFEAGIYGIVGMKAEALSAYLKGMGRHPERIDTYLLISNLLRETGGEMRAVRMFQYMAQTAKRDDLFTIAIDGILNLRAPRQSGVPDEPVRWALRTTMERLATKPHRFYLYRLAADLAEELKDMPLAIRALKAGLPVAGERRTPIMREIMSKCHALDPAARQIFGNTEFNPSKKWDATEYIMVGRRLLGQGDHVPPSIFMNLATIFIRQGDIKAAMRTFSRAAELLEYAEVTREAARVLEMAGEIESSLKFYRRLLATSPNDPSLVTKVGNIEEELGRAPAALDMYRRALSMIIAHKPQFVTRLQDNK